MRKALSQLKGILLLNGPNLNMLGKDLPLWQPVFKNHWANLQQYAVEYCFQANSEEKLIEKIHQSFQQIDFVLSICSIYSHRCGTTRCAFGCAIPFVEVHLSNVHKREPFVILLF